MSTLHHKWEIFDLNPLFIFRTHRRQTRHTEQCDRLEALHDHHPCYHRLDSCGCCRFHSLPKAARKLQKAILLMNGDGTSSKPRMLCTLNSAVNQIQMNKKCPDKLQQNSCTTWYLLTWHNIVGDLLKHSQSHSKFWEKHQIHYQNSKNYDCIATVTTGWLLC